LETVACFVCDSILSIVEAVKTLNVPLMQFGVTKVLFLRRGLEDTARN